MSLKRLTSIPLKTFASEVALALSLLTTPETPAPTDANVEQAICMARNVYHEARGESPQGQAAVAYVVLNRADSPYFPNTPCAVVKQRSQFSWVRSSLNAYPNEWGAYEDAMKVAVTAMQGTLSNPIGNATYFHASRLGTPGWTKGFRTVAVIGQHKFLARGAGG